jgi:hypothetical protein
VQAAMPVPKTASSMQGAMRTRFLHIASGGNRDFDHFKIKKREGRDSVRLPLRWGWDELSILTMVGGGANVAPMIVEVPRPTSTVVVGVVLVLSGIWTHLKDACTIVKLFDC